MKSLSRMHFFVCNIEWISKFNAIFKIKPCRLKFYIQFPSQEGDLLVVFTEILVCQIWMSFDLVNAFPVFSASFA